MSLDISLVLEDTSNFFIKQYEFVFSTLQDDELDKIVNALQLHRLSPDFKGNTNISISVQQ